MRRWTLIPIIVTVCGALAAGCGSNNTPSAQPSAIPDIIAAPTAGPAGVAAPLSQLVHVALSTTLVSSVHFTMKSTLHGDGQPTTVTVTGNNDLGQHSGTQDVTLSSGPTRRLHEVLVPQQIYFTSGNAASGPWTNVPRGEILLQHLLRPPANDPKYPLVQAKQITNVVKRGTGSLDGLSNVTHYTGILSESTMLQDATPTKRDHLAAILAGMPKAQTPVDVWVDKDGRVTRVTETISAASKGFSGTLTIDVSAYGIAVNKTAPKPSTPMTVAALPANLLG
ncbi:MAG TPA: hypothetical protein VFX70_15975 [Mycobacteriales bacterium]|nr:hypothetical protein [Mycobacteriales bacterium]